MKQVFLSYVSENKIVVDRLKSVLQSHGVSVWIDRDRLQGGQRWKVAIRDAIQNGAFFIACYSKDYIGRETTYMNEEIIIAIEQLRLRPMDRTWFIPVKLDDCPIPNRSIGGGETINDIQHIDLSNDWEKGIASLIASMAAHELEGGSYMISHASTRLRIEDTSGTKVSAKSHDRCVALDSSLRYPRWKVRVDGKISRPSFNWPVHRKLMISGFECYDLDLGRNLNPGEEFERVVEYVIEDSFSESTEYWNLVQPLAADEAVVEIEFPDDRPCISCEGRIEYGHRSGRSSPQPTLVGKTLLRWVILKPSNSHSYRLTWQW